MMLLCSRRQADQGSWQSSCRQQARERRQVCCVQVVWAAPAQQQGRWQLVPFFFTPSRVSSSSSTVAAAAVNCAGELSAVEGVLQSLSVLFCTHMLFLAV